MRLERRRAGANARSPGPFEIGSAERRNRTDNPLAAISWQQLKEETLGGERTAYWRREREGRGIRRRKVIIIKKINKKN